MKIYRALLLIVAAPTAMVGASVGPWPTSPRLI